MKLTTCCACLSVLLFSSASQGSQQIPFKASFHGFAEPATPTGDRDVVEIVVPLHGVDTHLGKFDERLVNHLNLRTGAFTGFAE